MIHPLRTLRPKLNSKISPIEPARVPRRIRPGRLFAPALPDQFAARRPISVSTLFSGGPAHQGTRTLLRCRVTVEARPPRHSRFQASCGRVNSQPASRRVFSPWPHGTPAFSISSRPEPTPTSHSGRPSRPPWAPTRAPESSIFWSARRLLPNNSGPACRRKGCENRRPPHRGLIPLEP
jgi:hypothetical protein